MRKCGLCCRTVYVSLAVCLSARLSRLCIVSKDIVILFLQLDSKRNPLSVGVKYTGSWENLRFSTQIAVYLGNGMRYAHGCQ